MYTVVNESSKKEIEMTICAILLEKNYSKKEIQKGTKTYFDKHDHSMPSMINNYQLLLTMMCAGNKVNGKGVQYILQS